jgi:hypothetical protein
MKEEPSDSKFWPRVDGIFADEVDCNWYGLKISSHSKCNILMLVFLYREFYDQDVEDYGFEEAVNGGEMVDPVLE